MASPGSCKSGFKSPPSIGYGKDFSNGLDVKIIKDTTKKHKLFWILRTLFLNSSVAELFLENKNPKKVITNNHKSIDPSWLPQTPVNL